MFPRFSMAFLLFSLHALELFLYVHGLSSIAMAPFSSFSMLLGCLLVFLWFFVFYTFPTNVHGMFLNCS